MTAISLMNLTSGKASFYADATTLPGLCSMSKQHVAILVSDYIHRQDQRQRHRQRVCINHNQAKT